MSDTQSSYRQDAYFSPLRGRANPKFILDDYQALRRTNYNKQSWTNLPNASIASYVENKSVLRVQRAKAPPNVESESQPS